MKRRKKNNYIQIFFCILIIMIFAIFGYDLNNKIEKKSHAQENTESQINSSFNTTIKESNNNLRIHYVDVGQGDSIIVEQNGHYMLIDAGTNACENDLISYIDSLNITKFDYIIATHAHEDHIGSMDAVINKYDVEKVLFSKHTTTTKTFENFVIAVKNRGLQLYAPNVNDEFIFQNSRFIVLAPNSQKYDDINNYSIVIKLVYGKTSYLFTGDSEELSESEMLNNNLDLSADVLKIAHHGSKSSTSQQFLNRVSPKYAIISVGKDNNYGHPTQNIINRLISNNIDIYRTDELGTIILTSDGKNISFNSKH